MSSSASTPSPLIVDALLANRIFHLPYASSESSREAASLAPSVRDALDLRCPRRNRELIVRWRSMKSISSVFTDGNYAQTTY